MMSEGVRRLDILYGQALAAGLLTADPSLEIVLPTILNQVAEQIENRNVDASRRADTAERPDRPQPSQAPAAPVPIGGASGFSIQVSTPTPESVGAAELSVSRVGGVTSALTTSPAVGGTSQMRVTYVGDAQALAAALRAQGWNVQILGGNALSISR
jgi:hypothetical protein